MQDSFLNNSMNQDPSHTIATVNQEVPHAVLYSSENGFVSFLE
jgi:hypothetical protein